MAVPHRQEHRSRAGTGERADRRPPGDPWARSNGRGATGNGASVGADPDAPNYYALLGVGVGASPAEITRAYRRAMKEIHPDRQRSTARRAVAEEQAKLLNRAYATLSKPLRRQEYDRTIRAQTYQDELMNRYVGGFGPAGATPDDYARALRREPTAAERRDRARADRQALVSLVIVFVGITGAIMLIIVAWALLAWLLSLVV